MEAIVGRKEEQVIINQLLLSKEAEFLAVYGRRRVGKTFLIRQAFNKHMAFQITGVANANTAQQLANFFAVISEADESIGQGSLPGDWFEAFVMLRKYLEQLNQPKK